MKTPHKHAEIIKAWADGAEIEYFERFSKEGLWRDAPFPSWDEDVKYRIKTEPKPDLVYYGVFDCTGAVVLHAVFTKIKDSVDQIKVTFDGESMKLKSAEILE